MFLIYCLPSNQTVHISICLSIFCYKLVVISSIKYFFYLVVKLTLVASFLSSIQSDRSYIYLFIYLLLQTCCHLFNQTFLLSSCSSLLSLAFCLLLNQTVGISICLFIFCHKLVAISSIKHFYLVICLSFVASFLSTIQSNF